MCDSKPLHYWWIQSNVCRLLLLLLLLMRKCYSALCVVLLLPLMFCMCAISCALFPFPDLHNENPWQPLCEVRSFCSSSSCSLSLCLLFYRASIAFSVCVFAGERSYVIRTQWISLYIVMSRCVRIFYYRIFRVNRFSTKNASTCVYESECSVCARWALWQIK